jgi:exopolysaccharide biosynthesis polyprenyl glycosylphosphotransferase
VLRRPHLLSPGELLRLVMEHVATVLLLFLGLVQGAFLRDSTLPSLLNWAAWLEEGALVRHGLSFAVGLGRFRGDLPEHLAWFAFSALLFQYAAYLLGLQGRRPIRRSRLLLWKLLQSAMLAGVVLALVSFFARPPDFGRTAPILGYAMAVGLFWCERSLRYEAAAARPESLLLVGSGPVAAEVQAAVVGETGYRLVGRIGEDGDASDIPYLGRWSDLPDLVRDQQVDHLLLADTPPDAEALGSVVSARLVGLAVSGAREFAESISGQVLENDPGVEFVTAGTSTAYGAISRLLDVLASGLGLLILTPLLLLVGLIVRLGSGGPVFFHQERIGRGGRPYVCWKFRTMNADAEKQGPAWSPAGDPRVTPLGRFLRRWRIDELPQLWNVLRGEMAFVGPRPEQRVFVERLGKQLAHYELRHLVRPGITGWAQVKLPYAGTDEDSRRKLRFDLYYIKHRSPTMDLAILFDTIRVVLSGRGR